jgi:hypothetical protein
MLEVTAMAGYTEISRSDRTQLRLHLVLKSWVILYIFFLSMPVFSSSKPEKLTGIYFPSSRLYGRSFEGIVHYMQSAGLNLAVLHAKDPKGQLFWNSNNSIAKSIGAPVHIAPLETAISTLKRKGIWTAVKLDVFQDCLLVTNYPDMGVKDSETEELWADRKGLHWANPYDHRVWDYTIALCQELIDLGVDEIQFDYVRFPTDGDMLTIEYPIILENVSKEECIGKFLAYAHSKLKPSGIILSVDVFGLTAWKTVDFGVGQVLEQISPHVDVICPMFYPSHFPENFLSLENPGQYPYKIMKLSLEEMKKRTEKEIRPWIQGFWYSPEEIDKQFQGVMESRVKSWTVWNPSGRYSETFDALAIRAGVQFPKPEFYPSIKELRNHDDLVVYGPKKIINHTCYSEGYSIVSLDDSIQDEKHRYTTITDVASTLDESIIDRILASRNVDFSAWTSRRTKVLHITDLIIKDLEANPRCMHPAPIYIDWDGDCVFTESIPLEISALYQNHNEDPQNI